MKTLTLFIAGLVLSTCVLAQEEPTEKKNIGKNEFGIHVGATTGMGLSYRRWVGRFGAQLTALPIKTDDVTFISTGLTLMYSIREYKYVRSYLYLGNHLMQTDGELKHNVGFGPGFSFGRYVGFNLMSGYGFYDISGKLNMYPTGEIGLYVKF